MVGMGGHAILVPAYTAISVLCVSRIIASLRSRFNAKAQGRERREGVISVISVIMPFMLLSSNRPSKKTLFNFFWVDSKKINHRGRGGRRALLFLRVLCALCGFLNLFQEIIKSLSKKLGFVAMRSINTYRTDIPERSNRF